MTAQVLHDAAVLYARTGWLLFPVSARGGQKAPLFPSPHGQQGHGCKGECGRLGHGFHDATSDPDTISRWWRRHPTALIGCRVAQTSLVLDVDPRGGGDDTLAELEAAYGLLPDTLTCYSGRGDGGRHLYLQRPRTPGWRLSGVKLKPGIDLIHHGLRYTILPPSPHPITGRPYWWADPRAPHSEPPSWLTALVTPPPRPQPTQTDQSAAAQLSVAGLVSFVLRQKVGGRHDAVLWALCRAYEDNTPSLVIDAICQAAVRIGKPPSEVDALKAWASANAETATAPGGRA